MIKSNQYGVENIQNELLDIMKIFHSFCEKRESDIFHSEALAWKRLGIRGLFHGMMIWISARTG